MAIGSARLWSANSPMTLRDWPELSRAWAISGAS